jgi:hypothetical protein
VILYYAAGGGLGHLTRATAVLRRLEPGRPAALLTASPFGADERVTGGLPVVRIPAELERDLPEYRDWLADVLAGGVYDTLYVDSFPGGILGELCGLDLERLALRHVARRLRWSAYERRLHGALPRYERTWLVEPLEPAHAAALAACSDDVDDLDLRPAAPPPATPDPLWLVVHSGPEHEVADLVAYADEQRRLERSPARLKVVSPVAPAELPPDAEAVDLYPAAALYPRAERIFTACGWNAMRETEPYRDRHRFVPYPRPLDDQHARAAAAMKKLQ